MIVWRPVSGTTLPRTTPNRTTRTRAIRATSTIRRSHTVAAARILITVPPGAESYRWRSSRSSDAGRASRSGSPMVTAAGGPEAGCGPPRSGEPRPVVQPEKSGYGLLAVCSALNVNVAAEVAPWRLSGADSGRLTPEAQRSRSCRREDAVAGVGALGGVAERGAVQVVPDRRRSCPLKAPQPTADVLGLDRRAGWPCRARSSRPSTSQ